MKPFLDSTDVVDDGPALKERMDRDGYLYIRELLPADELEDLRLQFLEIARDGGWVKKDSLLKEAIADLNGFCAEPQSAYNELYMRMYKLQSFHGIQHHPNLIGVVERTLDASVFPHPRMIGRTIFPRKETFTTPAHQDFIPIQGTPDTYSAWFALSDLPEQMGGLQLSAGSHKHGVYDIQPATGAGGMEIIDPLEGTWVNNPVKQGDVIFFHSMTVHKGVPCRGERLRMSMDARYQRLSDPVAPGSLQPHIRELIDWAGIYEDWPDDRYKYYWQEFDLTLKDYDPSYHEKRDRLAFELAEKGDERARGTLDRIIARDQDRAKRQKAQELLDALDVAG
tara:strand:+ start:818 stop:1831 length:1014 start_codon:yes stop_codon:yes gene_type:complete